MKGVRMVAAAELPLSNHYNNVANSVCVCICVYMCAKQIVTEHRHPIVKAPRHQQINPAGAV